MTTNYSKHILQNFDKASSQYNKKATLQSFFATRLAEQCSKIEIPSGHWLDLGSGTGLLANALEKQTPTQSVVRVDASLQMLRQHPQNSSKKLFDLNAGLPNLSEPPTLIASSFALHWLQKPEEKLKQWFSALAPGGWLAVAVPVRGSFPEWHFAAEKANVRCTAMQFPSHKLLLQAIEDNSIKYDLLESFSQEAPKVTSLLKSFANVGAQTSLHQSLTVREWRKLLRTWSLDKNNCLPKLTWLVQILLAQK